MTYSISAKSKPAAWNSTSKSFDARQILADAASAGVQPHMADSKNITINNPTRAVKRSFLPIASPLPARSPAICFPVMPSGLRPPAAESLVERMRHPAAPDLVCFSVVDSGVGIAPEDHEAIFDKFHLGVITRGVREGTGLGLAIARRLVEMQGGTIRLESAASKGSRFSFTMPAADSCRPGAAGQPVVLVVEDEPAARELLSSYLNPLGIRTECVSTADEGAAMARRMRPDAITLDVLLPGRSSGWTLLRELRAMPETRATPVFVISVLDEARAAAERGATRLFAQAGETRSPAAPLREHIPARFGNI